MKQVTDLPASETYFAEMGEQLTNYQREQYDFALTLCRGRRKALDVGAHVGVFSRRMAADFHEVVAYEPVPELCTYLRAHVPPNVYVIEMAANSDMGYTEMAIAPNGWSYVVDPRVPETKIKAPMARMLVPCTTVDRSEFPDVDLVKIDVQGAEVLVLEGAVRTLARCRPVVILEEKTKTPEAYAAAHRAAGLLLTLGARHMARIGADAIWSWE